MTKEEIVLRMAENDARVAAILTVGALGATGCKADAAVAKYREVLTLLRRGGGAGQDNNR